MLLCASFFIGRILVVRHPEHMMRLEHDVTKLFDSRSRVGLTKVTYLHRMDSPRVIILLSCCHFVVAWRCDGRIFFLKDRYNWLPARRRTMIPLVYCHGYINARQGPRRCNNAKRRGTAGAILGLARFRDFCVALYLNHL